MTCNKSRYKNTIKKNDEDSERQIKSQSTNTSDKYVVKQNLDLLLVPFIFVLTLASQNLLVLDSINEYLLTYSHLEYARIIGALYLNTTIRACIQFLPEKASIISISKRCLYQFVLSILFSL